MASESNKPLTNKRSYSIIGTLFVLFLAVLSFIVVPMMLFADDSPAGALAFLAIMLGLVVTIIASVLAPLKQQEYTDFAVRPPMELDLETFDAKKDGVSW
ncbi:MAG TPA: hypothetical protein DEF47_16755 [Herpetosiphon sp.]|uniref:Uncharacterized protein n=1 Tax=Herpetosiphon aurantiacus (strain ATCC 23779 / DSM 785 / 114-95) TaxID=316274 RepID=A9B733_HERA2|nr:hypothetical protein [Herpetosiphon sp.]ABX05901.1 hypothetical protein Haur_3264 [Herpetosiphon aurantiacus DSM 785]HBW51547.1 hypothetical protein [Herpetosiphon sp.]